MGGSLHRVMVSVGYSLPLPPARAFCYPPPSPQPLSCSDNGRIVVLSNLHKYPPPPPSPQPYLPVREMEDTESCSNNGSIKPDIQPSEYIDNSVVSTPYVSAPSSPSREPLYSHVGGFFYSAPSSPMHHILEDAGGSFEFELTGEPAPLESMTSADELFLNGQIRPMKLSSHLQRPQDLAPLAGNVEHDGEMEEDGDADRMLGRGRANLQSRDRRRKARSMSPLRSNTAFQWLEEFKDGSELTEINESKAEEDKQQADDGNENDNNNETPSSGTSSRSSSVGRSSKRWIFLKELLYRSKSEGRNSTNSNRNLKFWSTLSFSPNSSNKNQKSVDLLTSKATGATNEGSTEVKSIAKKAVNGFGLNQKRVGRSASAHEVHYTRNRAQAEEMRKKTYLPYRQGLLGCLGFSSKSYGAMNGFARALNPVSSR